MLHNAKEKFQATRFYDIPQAFSITNKTIRLEERRVRVENKGQEVKLHDFAE